MNSSWVLGVFYAKERSHSGVAQNILFAMRPAFSPTNVVSYNLRHTTSISLEQGQRLLLAIDKFLATTPESLGPMKMFNFELAAGPIDEAVGPPEHHPFLKVTFAVVCSVTTAGKYFSVTLPFPNDQMPIWTVELSPDYVGALRRAIEAAVKREEK